LRANCCRAPAMTSLRSRQWLGAVPAGTYLGRVSEPPAYARIIRPIGRTSARNVLACHLIQRAVWSAYSTEGRQPPPVADRQRSAVYGYVGSLSSAGHGLGALRPQPDRSTARRQPRVSVTGEAGALASPATSAPPAAAGSIAAGLYDPNPLCAILSRAHKGSCRAPQSGQMGYSCLCSLPPTRACFSTSVSSLDIPPPSR